MNDGLFLALVSRSRPQKLPPVALRDVDEAAVIEALAEQLALHVDDRFERLLADAEAGENERPPSVA